MIVKSALGILLLVFSVRSDLDLSGCGFNASDCGIIDDYALFRCPSETAHCRITNDHSLFDCGFRASFCGYTFGDDGASWALNGHNVIRCFSSNEERSKCKDLRSPSIPQLTDGPACLEIVFISNAKNIGIEVSMFNSSSSIPVTSNLSFSYEGTEYIQLPETSYTQFSIGINLSEGTDLVIHVSSISVFRCLGTTTDSTEATTSQTTTPTPGTTTPEVTSPEPGTTSPISCDLNTEGTCFTYFNESMSQKKAQETCWSLQGKLAELRTESIKNLLMSQVKSKNLKMWIGANDRDEEGSFVWESDNEKLNVSKSWIWGEPNNWRGNEDCVMMKPPRGKLNDGNCNMKLTFFCQF